MSEHYSLVRHLADINPGSWDALTDGHPFVQHAFLAGLESTGCAVPGTGWAPHFLLMWRNDALVGAMPLYAKAHSRGEYVFDHGWAQAYRQHGLPYYPKLLCAVPFTPVPGPRLLARTHADRVALARKAISITRDNELSSLHVLYPDTDDSTALQEAGYMFRENIQFHWHNEGYRDLDDFLAQLSQPKRKKLKQDGKKAREAGVVFRWLDGDSLDDAALDFFYECYERTYYEHGNPPYLNRAFFGLLREHLPQHLLIVQAELQGQPIAAALNVRHGDTLYGRYWGCTQFIPGLHFETCYTQAIAYCIAHGLQRFEGGAQGEHKLSRGMMPVRTRSAHWVADQRYAQAIADFLERETAAVGDYLDVLREHSPYKAGRADADSTPR